MDESDQTVPDRQEIQNENPGDIVFVYQVRTYRSNLHKLNPILNCLANYVVCLMLSDSLNLKMLNFTFIH
jgi:hypothetical protein